MTDNGDKTSCSVSTGRGVKGWFEEVGIEGRGVGRGGGGKNQNRQKQNLNCKYGEAIKAQNGVKEGGRGLR